VDGKGGWTSFELQGVGSDPLVQRSLSLLMGGSSGAILQLVCSVAAFSAVLFFWLRINCFAVWVLRAIKEESWVEKI
jgi:hypothetical protein